MSKLVETRLNQFSSVRRGQESATNRLHWSYLGYHNLMSVEFGVEGIAAVDEEMAGLTVCLRVWIRAPYRAVSVRDLEVDWNTGSPPTLILWPDEWWGDDSILKLQNTLYPIVYKAFEIAANQVALEPDFATWDGFARACHLLAPMNAIFLRQFDEKAIDHLNRTIFFGE